MPIQPDRPQVELVPDRMTDVGWPHDGAELYVDDTIGDGRFIARFGREWWVAAVLGHGAGVLHSVVWQKVTDEWTIDKRAKLKAEIAELLANRQSGFRLGGMAFRPWVTTDANTGESTIFVYRVDIHPEVLVAVRGAGGLILTPGKHRGYLKTEVLADALDECLAERTAA